MNREFLVNIALLITANLLIKPFYLFGIDRTVQNVVPEGDYGLYFSLFNFTLIFQIVNDFGIQNYNNRNISQHRQLLEKYFPNVLVLKFFLMGGYFAVLLLFAAFSGYELAYFPLLLLIGLNQVLNSLILFLRSNISGLGRYRLDSLLSVLDRLLLIIIAGALLWAPAFRSQFRIEWFVYAQTVAYLLTAGIVFSMVYRRLAYFRPRLRPAFLWLILRESYPYALVIFLMTLYTRIDGVMIERMLTEGAVEASLYASAYRLLDACNVIGFLFAGLLLPMFARSIKLALPVAPLAGMSFRMLFSGALTLATAAYFYRTEIMEALYVSGGAYSGRILGLLMGGFVAISGSYIYGALLTAGGYLMRMNRLFVISIGLNVGMNLLLIPPQGAAGAALATLVTQAFVFVAQWLLARKLFGIPSAFADAVRLAGFTASVLFMASILQWGMAAWWPVKFGLTILVGVLLAFLFRLIDLRQLAAIFQKRIDEPRL